MIKCHKSWILFFEYVNSRLNLGGYCKVNNQGYATLSISNTILLKDLKRRITPLNLPLMLRKWNIIDLEYIGRNERSYWKKIKIQELLNKDFKITEIANTLKSSQSSISNLIKYNNLKNETTSRIT